MGGFVYPVLILSIFLALLNEIATFSQTPLIMLERRFGKRASENIDGMAFFFFLSIFVLLVMIAEHTKQGIHEMVVMYWIQAFYLC